MSLFILRLVVWLYNHFPSHPPHVLKLILRSRSIIDFVAVCVWHCLLRYRGSLLVEVYYVLFKLLPTCIFCPLFLLWVFLFMMPEFFVAVIAYLFRKCRSTSLHFSFRLLHHDLCWSWVCVNIFCWWLFYTPYVFLKPWCSLWSSLGTKPSLVTLYCLCKLSGCFNLWFFLRQEHWCSIYTCCAISCAVWTVGNAGTPLYHVVSSLFWVAVHFAPPVSIYLYVPQMSCTVFHLLALLASRQGQLPVPKLYRLFEDINILFKLRSDPIQVPRHRPTVCTFARDCSKSTTTSSERVTVPV